MSSKANTDSNGGDMATFDTTECVTFESFSDPSYPSHLIVENLLRLLNYEGLQGIAELISFIVKSAGSDVMFQLSANPNKSLIINSAENIDAACIANAHPATFPLQSTQYVKRLTPLLDSVVKSLQDAENSEILRYVTNFVASLTSARLQSLRLTATVFAGIMASALSDEFSAVLLKALAIRCTDVAIPIRKRAVTLLGPMKPDITVRALSDENAGVRLAALRALSDLNTGLKRVTEMATQDVDQSVRRAALRLLLSNQDTLSDSGESIESMWQNLVAMTFDEDLLSRRLSAELLVHHIHGKIQAKTDFNLSAAQLLVKVCGVVTEDQQSSQAIAHGLTKVSRPSRSPASENGGVSSNQWPHEILRLLTLDLSKEARKNTRTAAYKAREWRMLGNELADESVQLKLLYLLSALLNIDAEGSRQSAAQIPSLLRKMQLSTELLSTALVVASHLPFAAIILASSDEESIVNDVARASREIFESRSEREILESLAILWGSLPESVRIPLCSDLHHDYRIEFANLLGPRGQKYFKNKDEIENVAKKLLILERFIDISDVLKLPLWVAINDGVGESDSSTNMVLQLVRTIAIKGGVKTMQLVVQKLAQRKPIPAVDDILRIFVAAKMRKIDIEISLPIDINASEPSSESVWRAAVAAGVI